MTTTPNWTDVAHQLTQPFPEQSIKWRVGSISKDKTRAQALAYAEARVYEDRLNEVCPGGWTVSFRPWGEHRIICDLAIYGITRSSTGEEGNSPDGIAGTAAEAQAFKRACSKFGLGRYLYDLPLLWVAYDPLTKRLKEQPRLPTLKPTKPEPITLEDVIDAPTPVQGGKMLNRERASGMHRELARLGIGRSQHYAFATRTLGRAVNSFTELDETEARIVWTAARAFSSKHHLNKSAA